MRQAASATLTMTAGPAASELAPLSVFTSLLSLPASVGFAFSLLSLFFSLGCMERRPSS